MMLIDSIIVLERFGASVCDRVVFCVYLLGVDRWVVSQLYRGIGGWINKLLIWRSNSRGIRCPSFVASALECVYMRG